MRIILDPDDPRVTAHLRFASVNLDLRPLAKALRDLPKEAFRGHEVSAALNVGIQKFNTRAYRQLKADTKIARNVTRLKRGVRIKKATRNHLEARYTIRDRNLRITKAYFDATYSQFGRAGAMARMGKSSGPAGAEWTSWDGERIGQRTFMIRGKKPVFIRLRPSKRLPVQVVRGPNPAEMMQLRAARYEHILLNAAQAELGRQIRVAYRRAEKTVKARYGL